MLYPLLSAINFILYLLSIFCWIALGEYLVLNLCVTVCTITFTIILILLRRKHFEKFVASNFFKRFIGEALSLFLIISILGLVNYLAYKKTFQVDLTKYSLNSLSEQSKDILKRLEKPLKVLIFTKRSDATNIESLLELYRLENNKLEYEVIDPDTNPIRVEQEGVEQYGTIIFKYGDRTTTTSIASERGFTTSILKLVNNKEINLCYVQGHRSPGLEDEGVEGIKVLVSRLFDQGIEVKQIHLALEHSKEVVKNCILTIWGPKDGFLEKEIKNLASILDQDIPVLVALDPQLNSDPFENLRNILAEKRSVSVSNDFVIDSLSTIEEYGGSIPMINNFDKNHEITLKMKGDVFFPFSSSVQILEGPGLQASRLLQTSNFPASWAEKSFDEIKSKKPVRFNQGIDNKGPITIGAAVKEVNKRTIVLGDSDFVQNRYQQYKNNFLLFSNMVQWLSDNSEFISFSTPKITNEKLAISDTSLNVVFYFAVIFAPLILLTFAFVLYRRKYGPAILEN